MSTRNVWPPLTTRPTHGNSGSGRSLTKLGTGVLLVRKPGKLPADTITYEYELEYGRDRLEMHRGILPGGARVLIVDDVLATGGTAQACGRLIEAGGATVAGAAFLVELTFLGGRERLAPHRIESLLSY